VASGHETSRRAPRLAGALVLVVLAACGSGPSEAAIAEGPPITTTTTEAPPEGVRVVVISNGVFRPQILEFQLTEASLVEFRHQDQERFQYVIRWENEVFPDSPELSRGDTYTVDFSTLPPDFYRYSAQLGLNSIPGSVDTRAAQ
jgi:hypothetical protein